MGADIIDGHAVDLEPVDTPLDPAPSTAVIRRERRSEVIRPLDAGQLADSMTAYQQLLPRLLDASDYQDAGRDKRFVKKSGWRKIATAFDLDVVMIRSTVDRDEHGNPLRAEVWARAIAPSGRSMDGDGYCSVDEERFSGPRGNRSKLENDLRATATTRAMNRAISGLVGMGEVSAEEVAAHGEDTGYGRPPHGAPADAELTRAAGPALTLLLAGDADAARACWGDLKGRFGYMPGPVAETLVAVANVLAAATSDIPAPTLTEQPPPEQETLNPYDAEAAA